MNRPVRVVLVDDHEVMRRGLRLLLETDPDVVVVGEAADGRAAVRVAAATSPHVVCMDVQMPGVDGLQATRELLHAQPLVSVLVLTTFDRDDYLFEAISSGASGFLVKNSPPERLLEAIKVVADGEALLSPSVTRRVLQRIRDSAPPPVAARAAAAALTPREADVLEQVALGRSNGEIAEELFIGEETVKTHVSRLLAKLGQRDRTALAVWALTRAPR